MIAWVSLDRIVEPIPSSARGEDCRVNGLMGMPAYFIIEALGNNMKPQNVAIGAWVAARGAIRSLWLGDRGK